jgi:hypothetical protein
MPVGYTGTGYAPGVLERAKQQAKTNTAPTPTSTPASSAPASSSNSGGSRGGNYGKDPFAYAGVKSTPTPTASQVVMKAVTGSSSQQKATNQPVTPPGLASGAGKEYSWASRRGKTAVESITEGTPRQEKTFREKIRERVGDISAGDTARGAEVRATERAGGTLMASSKSHALWNPMVGASEYVAGAIIKSVGRGSATSAAIRDVKLEEAKAREAEGDRFGAFKASFVAGTAEVFAPDVNIIFMGGGAAFAAGARSVGLGIFVNPTFQTLKAVGSTAVAGTVGWGVYKNDPVLAGRAAAYGISIVASTVFAEQPVRFKSVDYSNADTGLKGSVWKGVSLESYGKAQPLVGVSGGKVVFGSKNIDLSKVPFGRGAQILPTATNRRIIMENVGSLKNNYPGLDKQDLKNWLGTGEQVVRGVRLQKSSHVSKTFSPDVKNLQPGEVKAFGKAISVKGEVAYGSAGQQLQQSPKYQAQAGDIDVQGFYPKPSTKFYVTKLGKVSPGKFEVSPTSEGVIQIKGSGLKVGDIHGTDQPDIGGPVSPENFGFRQTGKTVSIGGVSTRVLSEEAIAKANSVFTLRMEGGKLGFFPSADRMKDIGGFLRASSQLYESKGLSLAPLKALQARYSASMLSAGGIEVSVPSPRVSIIPPSSGLSVGGAFRAVSMPAPAKSSMPSVSLPGKPSQRFFADFKMPSVSQSVIGSMKISIPSVSVPSPSPKSPSPYSPSPPSIPSIPSPSYIGRYPVSSIKYTTSSMPSPSPSPYRPSPSPSPYRPFIIPPLPKLPPYVPYIPNPTGELFGGVKQLFGGGRQRKEYQPSFLGVEFGKFTSKVPKGTFSGLEIRPMLRRKGRVFF